MKEILKNNIEVYKSRNLKLWMSRFSYESKSKNKLLFYAIKKSNIRMTKLNIFDFGFGNGLNLFSFNKSNHLYGVEILQIMIDFAKRTSIKKKVKHFDFKIYDGIGKINFLSRKFDIIICSHVLEHHPNDKLVLKEFKRILKKGGKIFILIPINCNKNGDESKLHCRNYSIPNLKKSLQEYNFTILHEIYFDKFSNLLANYLYINKNESRIKILIKLIVNFTLSVIPFSLQKFIEDKIMSNIPPTQFCISITLK